MSGTPAPDALEALVRRLTSNADWPRVICVGHTAYDLAWQVDRLPQGGGKMRALDFQQGGGGMAATAAVAVARLGGRAAFWGRAGDDLAGRAMADELQAQGVDVAQLRLFAGARSSVSGIVVDAAGERSIVNFRGAGQPDDPTWLPLDDVSRADAVLADPRWPDGAAAALGAARRSGVTTVLDGDVADAAVFDVLLPQVDVAVFSEPGLHGYGPDGAQDEVERLHHARRRGCRIAAVTQGARGLTWTDGTTVHRLPACAVSPIVDTTGAGDVFHGALALALAARADLHTALRFASAAAALKCRQPGPRRGIPSVDEVSRLLRGEPTGAVDSPAAAPAADRPPEPSR